MAVINDVKRLDFRVDTTMLLGGESVEFAREYYRRYSELVGIIVRELGVTPEEVMALPDETPIGAEAQRWFEDLKRWLLSASSCHGKTYVKEAV